jgi:hypothetical protein
MLLEASAALFLGVRVDREGKTAEAAGGCRLKMDQGRNIQGTELKRARTGQVVRGDTGGILP